jgi:hypothetical protein
MSKQRLPLTALDIQLDLLRHYNNNPHGRLYADAVVDAALYPHDPGTVERRQEIGLHVHRQILGAGSTYAITNDIVSVLEQAAATLPSFILHREDLPSLHGFVWLERPILVKDVNAKTLVIRAFGWNTAMMHFGDEPDAERELAVVMMAWTDPRDPRDHAYSDAWAYNEVDVFAPPHGLLSMLCGIFPFNQDWLTSRFGNPDKPDPGLGRFFLSFLRFIVTPWINTERYTPDRHAAKRAMRTIDHVPEIHVVHLRRRQTSDSEPGTIGSVDWSHRWIVDAHWRNQWYPSLGCHKPVLIESYVKGPEGLPLVVHDKIFSVER